MGAKQLHRLHGAHCQGQPQDLREVPSALTASHCVNKIITEMCVLEVTDKGLLMTEINPEFTVEQVQAATAAPHHCL